jgi:multiple sugar transport system substrate-binding protein
MILFLSLLYTDCTKEKSRSDFSPETFSGSFDWKRESGQVIKVNLNKHPFSESIAPQLKEFTQLTGIQVELNILSEEEYRDKMIIELSSGSGSVDVFMTGPYTTWSYVKADWIEPLDAYLKNPSLTGDDYGLDDFFPALLEANRWNGESGYQNYGKGSQWSVPVMVETYILAYRKDWAEELKLTPPSTYPDFYRFAKAMTRKVDDVQYYGITSRGLGTWPTVATGFVSGFKSYGCSDFDDRMDCMINTPAAVEFTTLWMKTVKECGPMSWTSNTWYDAKEQFESGRFGMIFDCDFFAASYENPKKSRVAGKLAYTLPPAGPNGSIHSNIWTWALSISKHSRQKLASWLFLQWATSKQQLLKATLAGNWNPVRKSVWNDPSVETLMNRWENYREVVEKNLQQHVRVCLTPQPQVSAVGDRWARALQEIWSGADPKATLDQAKGDIESIIERMQNR